MNSPDHTPDALPYALGHSERELERLATQARVTDPITRGFFRDAGIGPGMRVLDVGCGAGDTTALVAGLVGETGEVVGVDRVAAAVAAARARAEAHRLHNVSFLEGDPAEMVFERPFDAVTGRYVPQFQRDPAAMLRKIAAHVRRGASIVFQECDWDGARSSPPSPLYDQCCRWFVETLRLLNTETHMGAKLHSTFVTAGLPAPSMRLEAVIGGGGNSADAVQLIAGLVGTTSVDMERLGVATAAEIGFDTLAERMSAEAIANDSVLVGYSQIGAWSRV
jgi:SAM-dependent methyltransferase